MSPFMTTLLNTSANLIEAPVLIATAIVAGALRPARTAPKGPKPGDIDQHTLTDIGVEPGSITWLGKV